MGAKRSLTDLREADEVITRLDPRGLFGGYWWSGEWPDGLRAGVLEPRRGYRANIENLLLAALLRGRSFERVIDLGAGTGTLGMIAHYICGARPVFVERQAEVAARLQRTCLGHGLPDAAVVEADIRDFGATSSDLVVCNPPFFPPKWGRESANPSVHMSTHAVHGDVTDFLRAADRVLDDGGTALFVYDAARLSEVFVGVCDTRLRVRHVTLIEDKRAKFKGSATRVWCELSRDEGASSHFVEAR